MRRRAYTLTTKKATRTFSIGTAPRPLHPKSKQVDRLLRYYKFRAKYRSARATMAYKNFNASKRIAHGARYHRARFKVATKTKMAKYNVSYAKIGVGVGLGAAAVGTAIVARKVYKRRRARRMAAHHGYRNKPPRLTTAQRQQMARRRRRVRGRFA